MQLLRSAATNNNGPVPSCLCLALPCVFNVTYGRVFCLMLNAGYCTGNGVQSVLCDWCAQTDHPHFDLDNESFNTVTLYTFVLACLLCSSVLCGVVPLDVRLSRSSDLRSNSSRGFEYFVRIQLLATRGAQCFDWYSMLPKNSFFSAKKETFPRNLVPNEIRGGDGISIFV